MVDVSTTWATWKCRADQHDLSGLPHSLQIHFCSIGRHESRSLASPVGQIAYSEKEINKAESVKLRAYLCQLATIAKSEGWGSSVMQSSSSRSGTKIQSQTSINHSSPLMSFVRLTLSDERIRVPTVRRSGNLESVRMTAKTDSALSPELSWRRE